LSKIHDLKICDTYNMVLFLRGRDHKIPLQLNFRNIYFKPKQYKRDLNKVRLKNVVFSYSNF
jgi:hypothetical protein